jgi:hypothetical protein
MEGEPNRQRKVVAYYKEIERNEATGWVSSNT